MVGPTTWLLLRSRGYPQLTRPALGDHYQMGSTSSGTRPADPDQPFAGNLFSLYLYSSLTNPQKTKEENKNMYFVSVYKMYSQLGWPL